MPSALLDPFLLAVPDEKATHGEVESYIQGVLDWAHLRDEPWVNIYLSERTLECLHEEGCFPLYPLLGRALRVHAIDYVDANTVAGLLNWLMQQTPFLEDRFGVVDILADPLSWTPDLLLVRPLRRATEELLRSLAILGLVIARRVLGSSETRLATRAPSSPDRRIHVRARIQYAEERGGRPAGAASYPVDVAATFVLCESVEEFLGSIDPVEIWTAGRGEGSARLAIRLAVFARAREVRGQLAWENTESFSFGNEFWRSIVACGFVTEEAKVRRLLRCVANTVLGLDLAGTHALRETEGGNAPQRLRGGDRAMRRNIDYEYHLHYWERAPAPPELSNLATHNDFHIEY